MRSLKKTRVKLKEALKQGITDNRSLAYKAYGKGGRKNSLIIRKLRYAIKKADML